MPMESSMKTCVFTPSHETGLLVATSSWTPAALTLAGGAKARGRRGHPGPIFFRPLMVKGALLRPDRESGVFVSWECIALRHQVAVYQ
jgi:hypothetical protein